MTESMESETTSEFEELGDSSREELFEDEEKKEKEITKADYTTPEEVPIPLVLEPDHPMMQRFQAALKNHLLKQLDKISNQVFELDTEMKKKEAEKEQMGLQLYAMQQEMFRQQKTLEDYENSIESLMKERQSLDESVSSKKSSWKEEVNNLNTEKKKESDLIAEFQKLSSLEKQMEKWEKEMESELTVSQRISEKTQYDKNKLIDEKRKMDMCLLRLMTAISNFESEIRLLESEIDMKMEEKDLLSQTLADSAADLQALITEQKRLMAAWNSVVSTVNHRNVIYVNVSKQLTECQEAFRSLNCEIESYKRSSVEEMRKSEKMAMIINRAQKDVESTEASLKNMLDKKIVIEDNIASTAAMISSVEVQHNNTKMEIDKIKAEVTVLRRSFDKLSEEKRFFEDEAMNFVQEQIANDKTATHLNKLLRETRERSRKQEFTLIELENKISAKYLEVEDLKEVISRSNDIIKEMNQDLKLKEEELKKYDDEISKCRLAEVQKQRNYASLTRKIEKQLEKTNHGKPGQSPEQLRISELEKANAEIQAKNDKMQTFWLQQQNINVKLTHQRNEQLKDISLLRRQVLLLEQRAIKIDVEFSKEKKIESNLNSSIAQLQHKMAILSEVLIGKKGHKENLDKENFIVQSQFLHTLKDSETEQIRLKAEIKDLETNLEELAEAMLATQREILAWDKKVKSAVEAKNDMQKETSLGGEIGQMKAEIHRMEIRFAQLKRVQEKLGGDLEQCIIRRDVLLDSADAMEKRQTRNFNTKIMFQKKIENLKNGIRSFHNKIKQVQKIIEQTEEEHKRLKNAILQKEGHLAEMDEQIKKVYDKLEEGKLNKIQNLEMIIRKQKKCKMYEILKNGKHKMLFKDDDVLEKELQNAKKTNGNLMSILESLIKDFPAYKLHLTKIYNTLKAEPF